MAGRCVGEEKNCGLMSMSFFFGGGGKGGKCVMHRNAKAPCVVLQRG